MIRALNKLRTYRIVLCASSLFLVASAANAESFIRVSDEAPPGFSDMAEPQVTQADVYFGGEFVMSAYVEYDYSTVTIADPQLVLETIADVMDPQRLATHITGPLPTNAAQLCNSRRRSNCGTLDPDEIGIIFDDSRFRLDIFIHEDELLVHELAQQKYLPDSKSPGSFLSDVRVNVAGSGSDRRFNVGSDSYLSSKHSRLYSRYGVSDEGFNVYELSWQHDAKDYEYEVGSFNTLGKNLTYSNDLDVLGVRVATSTKTRADLDNALTTPIFLFLSERSRVDVYRGSELINSRFYDAGNQQIDTDGFPDGAYELSLRVLGQSGREFTEQHFFVRSNQLPPEGEPQYYLEAGTLVNTIDETFPQAMDSGWLRIGANHRLHQKAAWDNELIYAGEKALVQSGMWWVDRGWQGYMGLLASSAGDFGVAVRGGWRKDDFSANLDLRHISAHEELRLAPDEFDLVPETYTQAVATLAMPLAGGRFFVRGRLNNRSHIQDSGVGFSYWRSVYRQHRIAADLSFDSHFANDESWLTVGVTVRWQRGSSRLQVSPRVESRQSDRRGNSTQAMASGRWNMAGPVASMGQVDQTYYFSHDQNRSALGARFMPEDYPLSDLEFGVQKRNSATELFYAMNNRFSIAAQPGRTSISTGNDSGGESAAALLVNITGNTFEKFAVIVNNRTVGYARAHQPTVISLRPYETYNVRIRPAGERIVGFDESEHQVTLYPGNVQALDFIAAELTVIIGQATDEAGIPLANARFENVEGYGATDMLGWFQVEVAHSDPLVLKLRDGKSCQLQLPEFTAEDGLAMLDTLNCVAIPAQL